MSIPLIDDELLRRLQIAPPPPLASRDGYVLPGIGTGTRQPLAAGVAGPPSPDQMPKSIQRMPQTAQQPAPVAPPPMSDVAPRGISAPAIPNPTPNTLASHQAHEQEWGLNQEDALRNKLQQDQSKGPAVGRIHSSIENAMPNHPILGKILGWGAEIPARLGDIALSTEAPVLAANIPGTTLNHRIAENRDQRNLSNAEQGNQREAQMADEQAQSKQREAQSKAFELSPLTDDEAKAVGHPEWSGVPMNATQRAALVKQSGINQTKENTTDTTVAGRKDVAGMNTASHEKVAGINAAAHEATLNEKVREFNNTDQYRRWKEQLDKQTQERVASMTANKAPAAILQTSVFANGALNQLADAEQAMQRLEAKGVLGSNVFKNKAEDWIFKGGYVDPSLDPETRQDIGKLRAALTYTSSGAMRAHTGRSSREIYDDFKKTMGADQDWSALKGAMQETEGMLEQYADASSGANIEKLRNGQRVELPKPGVPQGSGGELSVTAPNGKKYTFKDQTSADEFKRKAGIK